MAGGYPLIRLSGWLFRPCERLRTPGVIESRPALTGQSINETLGVAGSGAIACGLAAVAARRGEVVLWARSDASAEKARGKIAKLIERCGWEVAAEVEATTDLARLGERSSYLVEAIVEELDDKVALIERLRPHLRE